MSERIYSGTGGLIAGLLIVPLVVGLAAAVLALPQTATGLADTVGSNIPAAGAKNPVTAVLLNFRSYDTLLEIAVLFTALLGALAVVPQPVTGPPGRHPVVNPILMGFVRLVAPLLVIMAGYLLWIGSTAPGGAFQAGAILASFGVLLVLCEIPIPRWYGGFTERCILAAGLTVFLGAGLSVIAATGALLHYPAAWAKPLILFIEGASTISIGAILFGLFAVGNPHAGRTPLIRQGDESS